MNEFTPGQYRKLGSKNETIDPRTMALNFEDGGTFNLDHRDAIDSEIGPSSRYFEKPESMESGRNHTTFKGQNLSLHRNANSDFIDDRKMYSPEASEIHK
jgi:hypothetical protein